LAPGSRASELRRVAPTLWRAARQLKQDRAALRIACVPAQTVREAATRQAVESGLPVLIVDDAEKYDAFAAATAVLAASGTVTTEIALQDVPVVIGYKLGWVTWAIARSLLMKTPYIALVNVAAGAMVAPEFVQTSFTAANLVRATAPLLDDPGARVRQVAAQTVALERMGRGGPAAQDIAADAVLSVMDRVG